MRHVPNNSVRVTQYSSRESSSLKPQPCVPGVDGNPVIFASSQVWTSQRVARQIGAMLFFVPSISYKKDEILSSSARIAGLFAPPGTNAQI
jgi:hypothetical protein